MSVLFLLTAMVLAVDLNVHLRFAADETQKIVDHINQLTSELGITNEIDFTQNIPHITLYLTTFPDTALDSVHLR